jgi:hypothetical protein
MTATTERRRAPGAGALRLYLLALLAAAYVVTWWLLARRATVGPAASDEVPEVPARRRAATWFHDLPASERPVVDLPAGWHIADRSARPAAAAADAPPIPVRVPAARPGRIRTRSS